MVDKIIVRRLMKKDVNNFFNLRLESLQKSPDSFLSSYEEEKNAGSAFFENILQSNDLKNVIFGAFFKDNLIGTVGVYQENAVKAAHKCNLWGMYVQAEYRNHGVGKLLLEMAIRHCKERLGCLSINLTVETNNLAAKNLYESFGFKVWGTEVKAMRINQMFYDEFHMSLLF